MKAYKYKLRTNARFVAGCSATLDLCRELYNAALQERRDAYQINCLSINYHAQAVQLPQIKQVREDVGKVHSQVLQDALRRVDKAFDAFFRRCQNGQTPGYPRFKPASRYDSFTYPQSGFRLEDDKLHLSKIGSCRVRLSRPIEGTIKTCTIKRDADGWYVVFGSAAFSAIKPRSVERGNNDHCSKIQLLEARFNAATLTWRERSVR